ncbi:hypothetical protein QBC32DRAFT_191444, partial [Pseudoneurospora amorphoporcata]
MVLEQSKKCRKCAKTFKKESRKKAHSIRCQLTPAVKAERFRTPSPLAPEQRTCGYCKKQCVSRNALFQHLKKCTLAAEGRLKGDKPDPVQRTRPDPIRSTKPPQIREAGPLATANADNSPISSFTHMRVNARAAPDSEPVEVCMDPGTGRTLIGRPFLQTLEHSIEKREAKVKGVGGRAVNITEWATFKVYLEGFDKEGHPTLMKFTKGAWVVEELEPNVLFGNDFLHAYAANTDHKTSTITFQNLDDFCVDFIAQANSKACTRRVTTVKKTTILPGQSGYIPVQYKPLPPGRSFMLNSRHAAAAHAVVNTKSPAVMFVNNTTDGVLVIPKHFHVGSITEATDSGYLALSEAMIAGMMAKSPKTESSLNREFDVPAIRAYNITEVPSKQPSDRYDYINDMTDNEILAELAAEDENMAFEVTEEEDGTVWAEMQRPKTTEKQSTLGIKTSGDLPEKVTDRGIHIYAKDPGLVRKIEKLIDDHPAL